MAKAYIPEKGDVVWLSFDPTRGHGQRGERPAIIISMTKFNERAGLAYTCPITKKHRSYPFRISFRGEKVSGSVMVDQLRSIDWKDRHPVFIEKAPVDIIESIVGSIGAIIEE